MTNYVFCSQTIKAPISNIYLALSICQSLCSLHRLSHLIITTAGVWSVKNSEWFEILKVTSCHSFMDAGRKHTTLRSETKDFITHRNSSNQNISIFLGQISKPQFPQINKVRWHMHTQWSHYKKGAPNLRYLNFFKWTVSMPFFAPWGETINFFQSYWPYRHPWANRPEQRQSASACRRHRNACYSWRIISQHDIGTIIIPLTRRNFKLRENLRSHAIQACGMCFFMWVSVFTCSP